MKYSEEEINFTVEINVITMLNRLLVILFVVLAAISVFGVMFGRVLYPGEELYATFLPNDILNLIISLPTLLISWWLMRQNRMAGLLCLPGVLFNVAYMVILNIIGLPLNFMFLPYILLLVLCIYVMVYGIASIDAGGVKRRLEGRISERFAGGVILFLAGFNLLYQSANVINAILQKSAVASTEYMLMIDDLAFNVPALLLGGVLLLRKKPLGYVIAAGLLLQYALLAAGAMPALIIHSIITSTPAGIADFLVLLVMVLLCSLPLAPFLKHAGSFVPVKKIELD